MYVVSRWNVRRSARGKAERRRVCSLTPLAALMTCGVVVSINEAREIADSNMQHRMRTMERGGDAACPECYKVFAQGIGGGYILAKEILL